MTDDLERSLRRALVRRKWATVDAAVRWATADSTSPQAAHGLDPEYALSMRLHSTGGGTPTVRATGRGGVSSGALRAAENAADRAMVLAALSALEETQQAVLVWYAWGLSYRGVMRELQKHGRGMSMTRLIVLHRYGRERMVRRLGELGYLDEAA